MQVYLTFQLFWKFQSVSHNCGSGFCLQQGDGFYYGQGQPQQDLEVTYLYIPESTVGACIGSKGSNIKEIMRLSGARIKVIVH